MPEAASPPKRKVSAGRNLPAAITTGLLLLVPAVFGIFFVPPLLIAVWIVVLCLGVWEVARALEAHDFESAPRLRIPKIPLYLGAAAMPVAAYWGGVEALTLGLMITGVAVLVGAVVWRVPDPGRSIVASLFVACWVPYLISFALLLLQVEQGQWRLAVVVLLVVANDLFGYIAGVFFGRHPMAPKVSPKKSWEGFAGSLTGAGAVGVLASWLIFDEPLFIGALLAAAVVVAATAGDFSESMVKRELGLKDMSQALPGHGGVMDRLDSLVFAMPTAYFVIVALTGDTASLPLG
ncbi:phosphatidate cytidylyltransferase [Nesterenkonia alkaliphila]|uniref:Phosphatidate cytidylyltransferase n=1 Tax=Nesterenkonia alkaliphila TaxID=1463631 RepID=A0A7K1UJY4_9MICC|nr:phosphatidate cytidylyltransferase [Nesterenkonia alkaliphila]MVT26805.1 phosphatidate cytidylyltransferase [Nesterenkonia alkaliphila]GFZ81581.1 phosphatidate cytidylyltransferase [Nesterenkonia alkaliphila]